ncbi:hypothetical protein C8C77_10323 [Halanaerobium saccharolyticum]|uniref:Uncharacterized protein n=1 Tax=Halanaerobium saccharolyticum TaxID=43595 RepID=A0A4R7Z7A9_9FIRM|nr:hypothetical protein [Halanaerobium saccharolyticum]RAK11045.1 hypothetical protein C7958_10323 [Halanaerobium saccharolyticum]TDW06896.1 hypothetical protein C8C77_10323 [Halanaerobium saccharolyticum]TDX63661.1 hypothetical protein C7956_10223 [Halanaerobium saccharolyticum]
MIINQKKIFKISLIFLLLFLLLSQGLKSREIIKEKEIMQYKISEQKQQNNNLKNEYSTKISMRNSESDNQLINIKEKTAAILAKVQKYDLILIDFSSTETELNLNLEGNFHSILNFVYYLENSIESLKIIEFKIKKNKDTLFFFVKLKNELI